MLAFYLKLERNGGCAVFKSVFSKYIWTFLLIILVSYMIIISIITSIIGNYSRDLKLDIMETAANSSAVYLQNKVKNTGARNMEELTRLYRDDIVDLLVVTSTANSDLTILLSDQNGRILVAVGEDVSEITDETKIHPHLIDMMKDGENTFRIGKDDGVFSAPHLAYGAPVTTEEGENFGNVFVCSSSMIMTDLIKEISKAIVLAILWVMMAALIAVYFITEKITGPLKKISRAAKQFASGKFDTRVEVTGSDEVAELALAFNNMAESLDNYESMRNTFISNVSHDLRTPMTSISGFVDGILDGVIPPEKYDYYLRIISNEVKRLSRLVSTLLDISKIQAGERKFTMAPFDICEMSRQIVISFEQKIEEKRLNVEFDCEDDNISVLADRDAIYQIMYNLCDNAVKFSTEGGLLRISIHRTKSKKLTVSVYNEGAGIPEGDIPYVFERFYKSDKSRGLNKTGVGLGLYISKTIIDAHNEKIWVESESGKSCKFSFTLTLE